MKVYYRHVRFDKIHQIGTFASLENVLYGSKTSTYSTNEIQLDLSSQGYHNGAQCSHVLKSFANDIRFRTFLNFR